MKTLKRPKTSIWKAKVKCSKKRKNLITIGETCGAELEITEKDLLIIEYETLILMKDTFGFKCPHCKTIASVGNKLIDTMSEKVKDKIRHLNRNKEEVWGGYYD